MTIPLPPPQQTQLARGQLTEDEGSFILDATLKGVHRHDVNVLAFIESFVRCKNIKQASYEAGVHPSVGYNYRHKPDISLAIEKIINKSAQKYGFDASEIMERTKEVIDFDPIAVQNADGTFISNLHAIEPEARRCIKKLKARNLYQTIKDMNGMEKQIIVGEVIEYEFYDKLKAVELGGKEKELFKNTTKVEHTVSKDMASILLEASRRGEQASQKFIETTARKVDDEFET